MKIEMVLIPAGEFVMGSATGSPDERPLCRVRIERPFWMGVCEITNEQFARFDPEHDSRVESKNAYQFGIHGYPMNEPQQPVVRVSWQEAMVFCRWLSEKTGEQFSLPTEAQWEWACRAGTDTPMFYGDMDTDFSRFANMGDAKMVEFVTNPYTVFQPYKDPPKYDDWIPKDTRFNDGSLLTVAPGRYEPNPWGLCDVHGNATEWTRTTYRPYPYDPGDGRDDPDAAGRKVARGGSWRDRPKRCTSGFRYAYQAYQKVYNVGFRVICEPADRRSARRPSPTPGPAS
jgi:formylglycine-generating enzyme required for sulfatase activity